MPSLSPRYRFGSFIVSPRRRLLLRDHEPVPLIPKYFDLLVWLIARRHEAVSKQAIFDAVWSDVVVSDGALSQAIRTLRRTLGDDSREPRFIRTVSRHGYQFVHPGVVEEPDDGALEGFEHPEVSRASERAAESVGVEAPGEPADFDALVSSLFRAVASGSAGEEARELAERLHALGTDRAISAIVTRPRHAAAVALMRDARWTVAGAGAVPLLRDPEAPAAIAAVVRLRLSEVRRVVAQRWVGAATGGAVGGAVAGLTGGVVLWLAPTSAARPGASVALALIGLLAGGVGAGGIGAGLIAAEVLARSRRTLALVACGAAAGLAIAAATQVIASVLLDNLFGLRVGMGTPLDGAVLGGAAGAGYALGTPQPPGGGQAAPKGGRRLMVCATVGLCCAAAATLLAWSGSPLIGGLVNDIARSSRNAQLGLEPLGHLIGEPGFGPITRTLLSAFEGGVFGFALTCGLTRRPTAIR